MAVHKQRPERLFFPLDVTVAERFDNVADVRTEPEIFLPTVVVIRPTRNAGEVFRSNIYVPRYARETKLFRIFRARVV